MQADQYDQSPEQITLTNQWLHTKKRGRDDDEIERDRKKVAAKKREKVFKRSPSIRVEDAIVREEVQPEVELSALTQTEVLEACVDESCSTSNDSAFSSKLISPAVKRRLHSRIDTPPVELRTIPKSRTRRNTNPESRLVKDLNRQIIKQSNIICELRQQLHLISEILHNNKNTVPRDTIDTTRDKTDINILETKNEKNIIIGEKKSIGDTNVTTPRTNIVNLHIH